MLGDKGYIFTIDAVLALIPIMIVLGSIAQLSGGELIFEQIQHKHFSYLAQDALEAIYRDGALESITTYWAGNNTAKQNARDLADSKLSKLLLNKSYLLEIKSQTGLTWETVAGQQPSASILNVASGSKVVTISKTIIVNITTRNKTRPTIKRNFSTSEYIVINGSAKVNATFSVANAWVNITIYDPLNSVFQKNSTRTDSQGKFSNISSPILKRGYYQIKAMVDNKQGSVGVGQTIIYVSGPSIGAGLNVTTGRYGYLPTEVSNPGVNISIKNPAVTQKSVNKILIKDVWDVAYNITNINLGIASGGTGIFTYKNWSMPLGFYYVHVNASDGYWGGGRNSSGFWVTNFPSIPSPPPARTAYYIVRLTVWEKL